MVLRNSRSIQKHLIGTGCELSYCDMRAAGCALCYRVEESFNESIPSCDGLTSRRVTV